MSQPSEASVRQNHADRGCPTELVGSWRRSFGTAKVVSITWALSLRSKQIATIASCVRASGQLRATLVRRSARGSEGIQLFHIPSAAPGSGQLKWSKQTLREVPQAERLLEQLYAKFIPELRPIVTTNEASGKLPASRPLLTLSGHFSSQYVSTAFRLSVAMPDISWA